MSTLLCPSSSQGLIQGPLSIFGGDSPSTPQLGNPIMLPNELNPTDFQIPPGYIIDTSNSFVHESNQVDKVIFNNVNACRGCVSVGDFRDTSFYGMNMANNVMVLNDGPFHGIEYKEFEIITFNLGDGKDSITVHSTSGAVHILNLEGQDDTVYVKSLSGPMLINGNDGNDEVHISSDEAKLNLINALLAFDGGNDTDADVLTLNNTGDSGIDDVFTISRLMVTSDSMQPKVADIFDITNPVLPRESYLINLKNATGGSFTLSVKDPGHPGEKSVIIDYPTTTATIEQRLTSLLLGGPKKVIKSCGMTKSSFCADPVAVRQLGGSDAFAVFFVGERLNKGVRLSLDTSKLIDFTSERYKNGTNDILNVNSDVAYTNVEVLKVYTGDKNIVMNVRGTSAETYIESQSGDDNVFVSSDADENATTADSVDKLLGVLDYIENNLHIQCNRGRHRLLISDSLSSIAKGVGLNGPAVLTKSSLENLAENLGNIYYAAKDGNWYDGISIWLGEEGDKLDINSIQDLAPNRTVTSVHSGNGPDILSINVEASNYSLFVANGQGGDDFLDASKASLPVILFGDGGNDTLHGGSNRDALFGDYGEVIWYNNNGDVVARAGGGGYGDFTDGEVRLIGHVRGLFPPVNVNVMDSGNDTINGHEDRDVIFGGGGEMDVLSGDGGSDVLFGDFAEVRFDYDARAGQLFEILSIDSLNCTDGNGGGLNKLYGGIGDGEYNIHEKSK